jgi:hypothetical protein
MLGTLILTYVGKRMKYSGKTGNIHTNYVALGGGQETAIAWPLNQSMHTAYLGGNALRNRDGLRQEMLPVRNVSLNTVKIVL